MAEVRVATDKDGTEWIQAPSGWLLCPVSPEVAREFADWRECKAVRIRVEAGTVGALEVTNDLDWLTSPEAES